MTNQLLVTFEGPCIDEDGVPLDDLQVTLQRVQKAVRLMVGHLTGWVSQRGRPPDLVRQESMLRLCSTSRGSLVAELIVSPPPGSQRSLEDYGPRALGRIVGWQVDREDSSEPFPSEVAQELNAIGSGLSTEVSLVRLTDSSNGRCVELRRTPRTKPIADPSEEALVQGWLKEVNWDRRTAQLHRSYGRYVPLRFDNSLDEEMLQLATRYVEVRGRGRFDQDDNWATVHVEQISGTRLWREPFDPEAFMNDPNPKIFDPENLVTVSEPFDVDEFIRIIYEGRKSGWKEP